MTLTSVLSLLVLVVSAGGSVGPSSNSSLCSESRECLQYELLCQTDEYEVRHYSPTLWVSTDAEAYFMGVGAAMAFRRLFQYITGANEGGYQMDMTAPVLVKVPEETRMWEPAIYTLSFPMPQAYQEKPPQPTNDKLYFTEMPDMDVYVRSYGGWMLSVTSRLQAHQLTKELDRVGASYNHTHHYGVGYDSPLKLLNRHNEVWYVCKGKPVCTDPQEPTPAHPSRHQADNPASAAPHSSRLHADNPASDAPLSSRLQANNPVSEALHSSRLQANNPASEVDHSSRLQVDEPASFSPSNAHSASYAGTLFGAPTGSPSGAPSSSSSKPSETPSAIVDNTTNSNFSQTPSTTVSLSQATPKPSESTSSPSEQSPQSNSSTLEQSPQSNSSTLEQNTQSNSSTSEQSTLGPSSPQSTDFASSQAFPSALVPQELTPGPSDPSLDVGQSEHLLTTTPKHQEPHLDAQ